MFKVSVRSEWDLQLTPESLEDSETADLLGVSPADNVVAVSRNPDCCCSVVKVCVTLWDSIDCSTPGSCLLLFPGDGSYSCPLSQRCYLTTSSSAALFSFCLQSFPASGSFPISWLLASGGQSIGASFSMSVLPMNIQDWYPLELTGLLPFQSKRLKFFSRTIIRRHQFFDA